jgi:hypothetical protein
MLVLTLTSVGTTVNLAMAGESDVVVMIDNTGSTSFSDLEKEKEATRSLLRFFNNLNPKPRIAIGSFNIREERATNSADAARIVPNGELTSNYGDEATKSGLFGAIDSIQIPDGYTDIGAAITVAQTHLETFAQPNNSTRARYIILISDGTSNRPGVNSYYDCDPCGCPNASASSSIAATSAKDKGTIIIGVHYTGNAFNTTCPNEPAAGYNFLKDNIVSAENLFLNGTGNLQSIFSQISCTLKCDDGNSCTNDSCNATTGQCVSVASTSDLDKDGVLDCQDTCRGEDKLLGTTCIADYQGNSDCKVSGIYNCSNQGDLSCTPLDGVTPICSGCTTTTYTDQLKVITSQRQLALRTIKTSLKRFKKLAKNSQAKVKYRKAAKAFARLNVIQKNNTVTLTAIPQEFVSCSSQVQCATIFEDVKYEALQKESKLYMKTLKLLQKQMNGISGAMDKAEQEKTTRVKGAIGKINKSLAELPKTRNECN